jgi:hypothetical protein
MLDNDIRHNKEIRMKEEPQWAKITDENEDGEDEDDTNETNEEQPKQTGREQAPPKQLEDYEVYVTIKEEDKFMLTTCADNGVTSSDAQYIMVHYQEEEKLKRRKKKCRPKVG